MISVIIPVYNTRREDLERCLESVLAQDWEDLEILVVDDGSEASVAAAIRELCEHYRQVCLIVQENRGVSAARNAALAQARGEFVTFVDGDDALTGRFFKQAVMVAQQEQADIVCGYIRQEPEEEKSEIPQSDLWIMEGEELIGYKKKLLSMDGSSFHSATARLFRWDILKEVRFDEDVSISEDLLFNLYAVRRCRKVVVCSEYWYIYYQNVSSATHQFGRGEGFWRCVEKVSEYAAEETTVFRSDLDNYVIGYLSGLMRLTAKSDARFSDKIKRVKELIRTPMFVCAVRELDWHEKSLSRGHRLRLICLKYRLWFVLYVYVWIFHGEK